MSKDLFTTLVEAIEPVEQLLNDNVPNANTVYQTAGRTERDLILSLIDSLEKVKVGISDLAYFHNLFGDKL